MESEHGFIGEFHVFDTWRWLSSGSFSHRQLSYLAFVSICMIRLSQKLFNVHFLGYSLGGFAWQKWVNLSK